MKNDQPKSGMLPEPRQLGTGNQRRITQKVLFSSAIFIFPPPYPSPWPTGNVYMCECVSQSIHLLYPRRADPTRSVRFRLAKCPFCTGIHHPFISYPHVSRLLFFPIASRCSFEGENTRQLGAIYQKRKRYQSHMCCTAVAGATVLHLLVQGRPGR